MENVPGIYSSKSGGKLDFTVVLNELLKICDENVNVPEPKKFLTAGAVLGANFSLAWRTLCASKFGVAQRRHRMFLVVDFTGERAVEILSEPEGKGRNFTPSYFKGENSPGSAAEGSGSVVSFEPGAMVRLGKEPTVEKLAHFVRIWATILFALRHLWICEMRPETVRTSMSLSFK